MAQSHIHFEWQPGVAWRSLRTGVSLHSHTAHSRESLAFVPRLKKAHLWIARLFAPLEQRWREDHGCELDYARIWWTPPLSARESLTLEATHIASRLGMQPLVSLSDHDNIDGPLSLRVLRDGNHTPVSVEWSVPWHGALFHLGVHNLSPRSARQRMKAMAAYTANPQEGSLPGLLDWLAEDESTLIVFNHPFWDEQGVSPTTHGCLAREFFRSCSRWLHAFELNGFRGWKENRLVVAWAQEAGFPVISGGDRHTCEPNTILNVTRAPTFAEFVHEVRVEGISRILVTTQYRESMTARVCAAVADAIRTNGAHGYGWTQWKDRVFWQDSHGEVFSIAALLEKGPRPLVGTIIDLCQFLDWRSVRTALRLVAPPVQEFGL